MFKIEDNLLNVQNQVTHRDLGYGRNDIGNKAKDFVWVESLASFMQVCEQDINEFIEQCRIDDKTLPEPDIEFLFDLDYPSAQDLLHLHPNRFCELLLDYHDLLVNKPYFDRSLIFVTHGFSINNIIDIALQGEEIILKGVGFYF